MTVAPSERRRQQIVEATRAEGRIEVTDLATRLGVASETIRRDLSALERNGLVRRIHGAAHPVDGAGFETTMAYRSTHMIAEKRLIAAAAAELIGSARSIYVDDGYTTQLVAERLPTLPWPITLITPSLHVAAAVAATPSCEVIVLGGSVRGQTLSTTGHWAMEMVAGLVIDVAVMGTNGITPDRGLTSPEPMVSAVKRKVIDAAGRRILVGVHTKFGINSFAKFADVREFEALVTDRGLRSSQAAAYQALGPTVVRV